MKKALICWGGWEGHTPEKSANLFARCLRDEGYEVKVSDSLDAYLDTEMMLGLDLIVPVWTMATITNAMVATTPPKMPVVAAAPSDHASIER